MIVVFSTGSPAQFAHVLLLKLFIATVLLLNVLLQLNNLDAGVNKVPYNLIFFPANIM